MICFVTNDKDTHNRKKNITIHMYIDVMCILSPDAQKPNKKKTKYRNIQIHQCIIIRWISVHISSILMLLFECVCVLFCV